MIHKIFCIYVDSRIKSLYSTTIQRVMFEGNYRQKKLTQKHQKGPIKFQKLQHKKQYFRHKKNRAK